MRIGIAGYMGAGKTTRARAFECGDVEVIDADARAKTFMRESAEVCAGLAAAFGTETADASGNLRFDVLARVAFESAESLRKFNGAVHPPLLGRFEKLVFDCGKPVCILDAALIPLWGVERWFDFCVWVDVPFEERFRRLSAKFAGAMPADEIIRRMRLQEEVMSVPDDDRWVKLPDDKCQEYILGRLKESAPDAGYLAALGRSVSKC